ncbi:MAG: ATP-binding cassette domain-containing protein [Hyphomicrobiaceae bacterium]|nr:ATP-binding cassette domain-containing protein [Hyphomicrobiaceae bacterium]
MAAAPSLPWLLRLEDITLRAGGSLVLDDVSLPLARGVTTVLLGPNGAGKTTLLKVAMGLVAPTSGRVDEATACGGAPRKAFVFQRPVMLRRSAAANVAFALRAASRPAATGEVDALLARVGLGSLGSRPARLMSGGEQQRLALARALARAPGIIFLDEPTASLDPAATKAVEEIIKSMIADGVTVVMSTHDLGQARRLADRTAFMARGRLLETGPAGAFFSAPATREARSFLAGDIVL